MSDIYVVVHIATTWDESNGSVTRNSAELIEYAWTTVDAETLTVEHVESVVVRPANTRITAQSSQLSHLSWEQVHGAGTFKDMIQRFDEYMQENIIGRNKEFSFVTFDLHELKGHIPREAKDKGVVLPAYLQHPRVFDLQNEYSKWKVMHPEALYYPASSISSIMTALEVSPDMYSSVQSSSSSASPSPESSSSTTSFSSEPSTNQNGSQSNFGSSIISVTGKGGSKRLETVELHSRVLIQLIKKSIPVEEHSNVLTRPYDMAKDVKIFLAERSKILCLSNLAEETTQSELESWFAQYGMRPIAFWSLKNNVDANALEKNVSSNGNFTSNMSAKSGKSTTGFAVLATHEEAIEALSMNGRVLNEKAVEVEASSTRILDRASDLLSTFPLSKNRPRPGDWTCPSCGFSNFQRRTACFRCSFPATSAATIQESIYPNNMPNIMPTLSQNNNNYGYGQFNTHDMVGMNTMGNGSMNLSHSYNDRTGYMNSNIPKTQNHNQGYANGSVNNQRHYSNSVPFRAGDWTCMNDTCQYHNFAKNLCCLKCGCSKPANMANNKNLNSAHLVNSTVAAIATATASGQSLNLSGDLMNLKQPQPHHTQQLSYQQNMHQQGRNGGKSMNVGNSYANNKVQTQYQYQQGGHHNVRGNASSSSPSQLLPQYMLLLQRQQQQQQQTQQQHQQHPQQQQQQQQFKQNEIHNSHQRMAQSLSNSPAAYNGCGLAQSSPNVPFNNQPPQSSSAPIGVSPESRAIYSNNRGESLLASHLSKGMDTLSLNNN